MFDKLRTNRFMKASSNNGAAVVEFTGKIQRIARVYQLGLKDKPSRNSIAVEYSEPKPLGFSDDDIKFIYNDIKLVIIFIFTIFEINEFIVCIVISNVTKG